MVSRALVVALSIATLAACSPGGQGASDTALSPEEIDAALIALGLGDSDRTRWDERQISGDEVRFEGFVLTDDDGTLTVETLRVSRPRLDDDGPLLDALGFQGATIVFEDGQASFDQFTVRDPGPGVVEAMTAFFEGREVDLEEAGAADQSFELMAVSNLAVNSLSENGAPLTLATADITATEYDGQALERFQLLTLAFETETSDGEVITFTLDAVELDGFASGVLNLGAARPFTGGVNIGDLYESVLVGGLSLNAAGLRVEMPEFRGETDTRSGAAVAATISMPELVMSADPSAGGLGNQFQGGLEQLGFEQLHFSLQSTTVYDPVEDRVRTEGENALVLRDGFRLTVEQDFSGVAAYAEQYAAWLEGAGAGDITTPPVELLNALMLNRFVLALEDEALLDTLFATTAARRDATPQAMRSEAAALVGFVGLFAGGVVETATLQEALSEVTAFINTGGTLTVAVEPDTPLPVGALSQAGPVGAEQGVRITHTPPD